VLKSHLVTLTALVVAAAVSVTPAYAQKGKRPPRVTPPAQTPSTTTNGRTSLPINFGSWLDDASTLAPGTANVSVSAGRWSARDGGQTDGPVFDVSAGVAPRVQVGVSVPFYHAKYSDGFKASGRGDVYLTSKFKIISPDDHRVGVSVTPLVEILSDIALSDTTLGLKRVNWALPVSVQAGTDTTQVFLTSGYFSRGAVFAGAGLTRALNDTVTVMGSVGVSHSTKALSATDLAGLSTSRTDATLGMSVMLSSRVGLSGNVGRTVSKLDQNGARFTASFALGVLVGHARP
jgi:hypothetical protein